ncbi:hypothetical protein [Polynucleobacter sp. JS-JIR-5-A7]|uniref:hypothetical protein n=1 Tax=Polynucleobacter sp. JS-JIR-5-A7 TaxID=1758395 RepID=UPI001BFD2DF4|nr:hypothetical protein [Polynucleobacter sp. JS-JIR-5-A7]
MTEVKSNIELCFGLPSTEKCEKNVNDICIRYGYTYEEVRIIEFRAMFETLMKFRNDEGSTFTELFFISVLGERVTGPTVTYGTYDLNGNTYPKLIYHGEYLEKVNTNGRIFINDEIINKVGQHMESLFEFEFVESRRVKQ